MEHSTQNTAQLTQRARTGDQEAMAALYELTYSKIYYTVRSMVREEQDALDIIQDSYIKAFTHLDRFDTNGSFLSWLRQIAVNTARDWLRRKRPTLFSDLGREEETELPVEGQFVDNTAGTQPEEVLDQNETRRLIREILDSLPEDQRMVIGLYYYQDLPVKEIAALLDATESAVKSRLLYGRRKIEAQVRDLEKKGTKLYGLAPVPFLLWLIRSQEAYAAVRPDGLVLNRILAGTAQPAAAPGKPGTPSAGTAQAAGAGAQAAGGAAGAAGAAGVKIALAALAVTAAVGLGVFTLGGQSQPVQEPVSAGDSLSSGFDGDTASDVPEKQDDTARALEQYAAIVRQAADWFDQMDGVSPTGSYRYALVRMAPEDSVPTLLLEQETEDFMYHLRVFQYDPDSGTVFQPEQILTEGVAPVGGYRGSIGLESDGHGLSMLELSSGTGQTGISRITLEDGTLKTTTEWSGRFDQIPEGMGSEAIDWQDAGDLTALENWTMPSETERTEAPKEQSSEAERQPEDGKIEFTGTIDTYSYEEVVELQGSPDPNAPWSDTSAEYRLIVLDTPQEMELQGLDAPRSGEVRLIDVTYAEGLEQYDGQHLTFRIDPEKTYWPSDSSLPLGQPSTREIEIVD